MDERTLIVERSITTDPWTHVIGDAPAPQGSIIVPAARWATGEFEGRTIGVCFPSHQNPADDMPAILDLPVIAIEFPKFADGRGYSYARQLRARGYTGQIRAVGDILRDQLLNLWRCGFDAFEVSQDMQVDALKAFSELTVSTGLAGARALSM